jgi:hypothetical protein
MRRLEEAGSSDKMAVDKPALPSYTHAKRLLSGGSSDPRVHLPAMQGPANKLRSSRSLPQASRQALSRIVRPLRPEAPTPHPPLTQLQLYTSLSVALVAMG